MSNFDDYNENRQISRGRELEQLDNSPENDLDDETTVGNVRKRQNSSKTTRNRERAEEEENDGIGEFLSSVSGETEREDENLSPWNKWYRNKGGRERIAHQRKQRRINKKKAEMQKLVKKKWIKKNSKVLQKKNKWKKKYHKLNEKYKMLQARQKENKSKLENEYYTDGWGRKIYF